MVAGTVLLILIGRKAPSGYEDERGFHFGVGEGAPQKLSSPALAAVTAPASGRAGRKHAA